MNDLNRVGKLVRREFSSALMSDTKWRKLFSALDEANLGLEQIVVKFVDVEEVRVMKMPTISALHPPLPYIDSIEFGIIELRSIEWLEIPSFAVWSSRENEPALKVPQKVDEAEAIIAGLGAFPVEKTDQSLRITGYIR